MQFAKDRFSQAHRHTFDYSGYDTTDSIAFRLDLCYQLLHLPCLLRIRTADRIILGPIQIIVRIRTLQADCTDLGSIGFDPNALLRQYLLCDRPSHAA